MTSCSSARCNRPMTWQLSTWGWSSLAGSRCRRWRRGGTLSSTTLSYQSEDKSVSMLLRPLCFYLLLFISSSPSLFLHPSLLPSLRSLPLPPSSLGWLWRLCVPCTLVWSPWLWTMPSGVRRRSVPLPRYPRWAPLHVEVEHFIVVTHSWYCQQRQPICH